MKTKMGRGLAAAVVAAMLFSQTGVYAYESGDPAQCEAKREAHFKKMTEELKLTLKQQEQFTRERKEFASKSKDLKAKMQSLRSSLKAELEKPALDKGQVDNLTAELKNLAGQQIQNRVDKIIAMKQILTPEQFSKMKCSMEKDHGKRGKRGKGDKYGHKDKGASHDMI